MYTPEGKIYYSYTFSFALFFFKEGTRCREEYGACMIAIRVTKRTQISNRQVHLAEVVC